MRPRNTTLVVLFRPTPQTAVAFYINPPSVHFVVLLSDNFQLSNVFDPIFSPKNLQDINMKANERSKSGFDSEKQFQCAVCSKKFRHKRSLTVHLITHTKERPFKCNKCSKTFNRSDILKRHILVVHDKKKSNSKLQYNDGCNLIKLVNEHKGN